MGFFIFIIIVFIIILFVNHANLKKETSYIKTSLQRSSIENIALKKEIDAIKKILDGQIIPVENISPPLEEIKEQAVDIIPEPTPEVVFEDSDLTFHPIEDAIPVEESVISENVSIPPTVETIIEKPILTYESQPVARYEKQPIAPKPYVESAFSIFLKKAEKQFADNWTGILGTAIMVLGIGYLSIYTALKVSPLFRILILWLYAGLLVGSYYILQKKEKWEKTGLWLRSAGASLFLFGCFGASQIEALSFITNTSVGYGLIGLGIGLNLYIGYIIKQQSFLSLHVVLSMLILCVIPDKLLVSFLLAAITCTIGIVLSYKEKWEYHLLIVIAAFIIFDIWFNAEGTILTATENIFAILGIIMVSGSCMFMQYRNMYANTHFEKSAFITHLINWILFATGLILHATGNPFKTIVLFIGAILCFFMALQARKKKIFWLYHLDGMVSFILLALSIILLNDWHVGVDIIACILYLLTISCLFVVFKQKETLLYKIFLGINHFIAGGLILFCALLVSNSLNPAKITSPFISTTLLALFSLTVPVFTAIKKEFSTIDTFFGDKTLSLNGLLSIVISVFAFLSWNNNGDGNSFFYVVIVAALLWCFLRKKFESKTFDIGRVFFFITTLSLGILLLSIQEKSYADWTFTLGIFAVIAFNWTLKRFLNNDLAIRLLSIIGSNIVLLTLTYKYLPGYQIIQIFTLFGIALLNYEFLWFNFKRKNLTSDSESILYFFYYFFVFTGSILFLYHCPNFSNTEIGLTCIGISAIESYVLLGKRWKNKSGESLGIWTNFNLLNSELLLFNALLFGFSCLQSEFNAVFLAAISVIAFIGCQKLEELKRYGNYSFLLLTGTLVLSLYLAFDHIDSLHKTVLYSTQLLCFSVAVGYFYLLVKSKKEESKTFASILPYVLNSWIIILFFIQIKFGYLPLLFMALALVNFGLIISEKVKLNFRLAPVIALLAIVISVIYSFDKLNNFNVMDWVLQLGSVALGIVFVVLMHTKEEANTLKLNYPIVLNVWLSLIMFSQLPHQWLPVYWAAAAIINLYLYYKKIGKQKNISIVYYLLANLHLAFLSFNYYEYKFLMIYALIFALLAVYIYLAYKWMEEFEHKNSLLIYPATLSIGCFLYLTFDKGILTFFWILEALGILILGIALKEKYFRYVSLSLVGLCVIRLMFFDLSNADFLIRALVLVGVGVVLIIMNSLFKKYKERFD